MTRRLPITEHLDAAAMLARDVPVAEVARQKGVTRRTIQTWAKTDEAQAHIAAVKAGVREATKALSVADKVRRIQHAQTMFDGVMAVIESRRRAGVLARNPFPGEETGHVAVKTETLGNAVVKREAAFDASIHAEARKWLEYAAKELGDVEVAVNVKHGGRIDHRHEHRHYDFSMFTPEEQGQIFELADKREAGLVSS